MTITLERAIEIGAQILAINSAIAEAKIGYQNKYIGLHGKVVIDFFQIELFTQLSNKREELRRELIAIE